MLRGHADLLRSSGQRELLHYEALRSREAAVEHHLKNAESRLETRQRRELLGLQHRETLRRLKIRRSPSRVQNPGVVVAAEEFEDRAAHRLHLANCLLEQGKIASAKKWLEDIVRDYPGTAAADYAKLLLAGL
jgi:quinol monooxygenase YgiN